jgi:hypothetical protein
VIEKPLPMLDLKKWDDCEENKWRTHWRF